MIAWRMRKEGGFASPLKMTEVLQFPIWDNGGPRVTIGRADAIAQASE